jgi:hypothetical protein
MPVEWEEEEEKEDRLRIRNSKGVKSYRKKIRRGSFKFNHPSF